MRYFFISDVHLRLDRPRLGERLARFVNRLGANDILIVGGDLCDFWFASRQAGRSDRCAGLGALAEFRARGGELRLIRGNHDWWLASFYQERLSTACQSEPLDLEIHGFRVHLAHGHRIRAGLRWKRLLESKVFLTAFSLLPGRVATALDGLLADRNEASRPRRHRWLKESYRQYVRERLPAADIFVFGHVHERIDERISSARMVVLGNWDRTTSYLQIDESGASFLEEE